MSLHLAFLHDTPADNVSALEALEALEATGLYDAVCTDRTDYVLYFAYIILYK